MLDFLGMVLYFTNTGPKQIPKSQQKTAGASLVGLWLLPVSFIQMESGLHPNSLYKLFGARWGEPETMPPIQGGACTAALAQLAELPFSKREVVGSNPTGSSFAKC